MHNQDQSFDDVVTELRRLSLAYRQSNEWALAAKVDVILAKWESHIDEPIHHLPAFQLKPQLAKVVC
ncbi:hypothetical protein HNQ59_003237 [Chitinivorax tropicus]|uniref:Uncharacterized protein n=1 Tax=Chitinivorax tropicus TaxID=714531 RepID=A0A840MS71_9PROT|nr:hypothetical protein [Chitinivorax tropicus]MBB5019929.1 hypothetical protein [Chitinivorax tropicus]